MNNKKRITTGLVGATLLCATNTVIVQAQENTTPTTVNVPVEPGQQQPNVELINAASTSTGNPLVDKLLENKNSPASKLGDYSTPGKSDAFISQFKKEAQLVAGTQGKPDLDGKKEFDFSQSTPAVKVAPDADARLFKVTPSAFVDPSGNSVLNFTFENPHIPTELSIKDAEKYKWTVPGKKEVEVSHYDENGDTYYETSTEDDYDNPVIDLPRFYFDVGADENKIVFREYPSEQGIFDENGNEKPVTAISTRLTKGKSIIGNKGNYLRVTESSSGITTSPGKGRYGYGASEMFNAGEYFEYEFPVNYSSRKDTANGGYTVTAPAKLVIDRRQEYGTPQRVETSEGDVTYSVPVKNTGNVAVGGYHITAPDGTKGKLDGKDVLQPGETGTLSVKYKAGADKDVALKVGAANLPEKTVTHVGKFVKLEWGNLLFAGNPVDPKTPVRVQADKQLVFQIEVTNTGNDSLTSIPVKLPNGEIYTAKQTIEPGKKTSVNVPYTPKKGETALIFTAVAPGQPEKEFTARINPQAAPTPKETTAPSQPTKPKDTTAPTQPKNTTSPAKPTPEQNKKLWDLGTLQITDPIEEGDSFKLPLSQLKNPSNGTWAGMFIVSEDGRFVRGLDDRDALVVASPGRNFPEGILNNEYTPADLDEYAGKKKQTFTIYTEVPNDIEKIRAGKLDFIKDFGTPVATFDYRLLNFVTDYENYFNPIEVKNNKGKSVDAANINLLPGDTFSPEFILKKNTEQERTFSEGFDIVAGKKPMRAAENEAGRFVSKDFVLTAPEKTGEEKVGYHFRPSGSDVYTLNRGEFTVRNVLKDDSKVPQVEIDGGIGGKIPGKPGEDTAISVKRADSWFNIDRACDANGKCYKVEDGKFKYTPTKEDLKTPKKFFLVNDVNLVVGKMDVPFDQRLTESKIEVTGKKEHTGYFGDSFKQEVIIHNYTEDVWKDATIYYRAKQNNGKYRVTSSYSVIFDEPLQPFESTTVTINVNPLDDGVDTYEGMLSLDNKKDTRDITDVVKFNLSKNPDTKENPAEDTSNAEKRDAIDVELNARFPTNRAPAVEVTVKPGDKLRYEVQNTGSTPMLNAKVIDSVVAVDNPDQEFILHPVPVNESFGGTLLPGQREVFVVEVPKHLDPKVEYHTKAEAIGEFPPRPGRGRDVVESVSYGDDPASVLIVSPREDVKKGHIVVSEGDSKNQYVRAKNPEGIEIVNTDMKKFSRTYKNPDGSIITVSPNEVIFEMEGSNLKYRQRGTNKILEQVMPDGTFKPFEADSKNLPSDVLRDPHLAKKDETENDFLVDYAGVHTTPTKEGDRRFIVNGFESIPYNFPYLKHNMANFYQDVVGSVEADAKRKYYSTFMTPSEPKNSVLVDNGRGGVVLTAAAAQTRGPGSYEEELDVFDRVSFTSHKVKVGYTIHPDGTASVDFIEAPEGMEFDVALYRPKGGAGDVFVDEQGRTHDGSGNKDTAMDRLRNRFAGKDAGSRNVPGESGQYSTDTEDTADEDGEKDETPFSGALAVTGVPAGLAATVLLALVSLLGAIVVMRRGRSGRGE